MAKGRMLSKQISLDEKVNALPDDSCRLLFTWLIPHLDVEGRMDADPQVFKSIVSPRLNISTKKVAQYLEKMEELKLILRYYVNGTAYLCAPNFQKHQTGLRKERESQSRIPPPPPDLLRHYSVITPDLVPPKFKYKFKYKYSGGYSDIESETIAKEKWQIILKEIQRNVSRINFDTFYKETMGVRFDDNEFVIEVPNEQVLKVLKTQQISLIERVVAETFRMEPKVKFIVKDNLIGVFE